MFPEESMSLESTTRTTVDSTRICRFERDGRGSIYAERGYDRVQLAGLIVDAVMKPPMVVPAFGFMDRGIPTLESDAVQLLTALIIPEKKFREK